MAFLALQVIPNSFQIMNQSLNELDEALEKIDIILTPTNFRSWLQKAENDYEDNTLFALIEDEEHFSSIPSFNDSTSSIRGYLSKAPIEPKLSLRFTLNTYIQNLQRIVQNKLAENLASDSYKQELVGYVCRNIKMLAARCQSEVIFFEYNDVIFDTLGHFEYFVERRYGLTVEAEISLKYLTIHPTADKEILISNHIDRIFAHLAQKGPGLPGDLTPAEYLQFKDSLLKTIIPGNEAPKVYNFKTPRISGESLRYSFFLFSKELGDDTRATRKLLVQYLITYFDEMKKREVDVLVKTFKKPKPQGYHYRDENH